MIIAEKPVATLDGIQPQITDGVHRMARRYNKGVRIDTHTHREAQLVYAARGMMQVTTPKGRWLVPPDRAVWVPARLAHAIDVLADIDMRTLYFDVNWLGRQDRSESLRHEYVVRVSRLLHEAILALFDGRDDPERAAVLVKLALLELHEAEDFHHLRSVAARAALPARRRHCASRSHRLARDRSAGGRGRNLGADAVPFVHL